MDFFSAVLYGIIQGLTEFLPVSSSAHLAILPKYLSIQDPGVTFDLAMHFGTSLAIMLYFYKDLKTVFGEILDLKRKGRAAREEKRPQSKLGTNLVIAFCATAVMALLVKGVAIRYGRVPWMIAFNLAIWGLFFWVADYLALGKKEANLDQKVDWKKSLLIGVFQGLAVFPGVSRSGITISMARMVHLSRYEASRFSFLLSLPVVLAAILYKLPAFMFSEHSFSLSECALGVLISFITGLITIHFFMKLIQRLGAIYFTLYRLLLAGVLIYTFYL